MGLSDDRVPALGWDVIILKYVPGNYIGIVHNSFMRSVFYFAVQLFLPDFA
jgi:hypothetical protein